MTDVLHREARHLLGIPFVVDGRDFRPFVGGTDCLGLVWEFRRRIGLRAELGWARLRETWSGDAAAAMPRDFVLAAEPLCVGDVGVTADGAHVCVYAGGGWVLHAQREAGVTLSERRRVPVRSWWRAA